MLQDFFSTIGGDQLIRTAESILSESASYLPEAFGISSALQIAFLFCAITIGLGFVFRVFFGKRCSPNQAVSTAVGILFIYAVTIIVYALNPWNFAKYLSPLPFALFRRDILILLPFRGTEYSLLCTHILSLIILCFIVHLLDFLLPTGKSFLSWLFLRCVSIGLAIFCNLSANWVLNLLLPAGIAMYAPTVLLIIFAAALIIGLFNPLLCIIFTVVNPVVGLLYTFFFSNTIGKQLTKSVISTGIICFLFYALEFMGYTVIDITSSAIVMYLPVGAVVLLIWYIFDYKF